MARIRTIKPAFFSSLSNADLPIPTRMTWIGLWTYVDDKGRGVDDARLVKAAVWPLDDAYTTKKVEADLVKLEKAGKIGRYIVDGQRYLAVVKWRSHQRIDKPQPSMLPPAPWEEEAKNTPGTDQEDSTNVPGTLPLDGGTIPGAIPPKDGGEVEGKGKEGKWKGRSTSPSPNHQVGGAGIGNGEEDQNPEPQTPSAPPDPLVDRLSGLWPGRPRMAAEVRQVVSRCRTVADDSVIDEAIGAMLAADDKPRTPNYLLATVRDRLVRIGAYAEGDEALDVLRTGPKVRTG